MSSLPFELLLALRYLRPKRTFVSIITLISVLGVTLGVAVLLIVISVMSGFDKQLRDKVFAFNAHLKIWQVNPDTGRIVPLKNYSVLLDKIKANPSVTGVTPFIVSRVLLQTEPSAGKPLIEAPAFRGMDPETETSVSHISSNIISGSFDVSGHGLLVGKVLASNLGLQPGSHVAIHSPADLQAMEESRTNGQQLAIPPSDYTVRGIFDAGFYEFNSQAVVASLQNAQDLLRLDNDVTGLLVMIKDAEASGKVREQLYHALGANIGISVWQEEDTAMAAVMVEKNVMLYIMFFIVIVAAFGISCTLVTFVVLKTREIGVLKALGSTNRQIMWIFLSQSMMVSVMGVMTGLAAGTLAIHYRNEFLLFMRRTTGMELFPASVYGFDNLPALIVPNDVFVICGGSLLICLIAATVPAWNASRLEPVEALRHE